MKEPQYIKKLAKECTHSLEEWKKTSLMYNKDCNNRFLGRMAEDKRRANLRKKEQSAFRNMMKLYGKLYRASSTAIKLGAL